MIVKKILNEKNKDSEEDIIEEEEEYGRKEKKDPKPKKKKTIKKFQKKLTKTEINSPLKKSSLRNKNKKVTWKEVQNALALDDSLSPRKSKAIELPDVNEEMEPKDEVIGIARSPSPDLDVSPGKSPVFRKLIGRLNDSMNMNNMSRRSIMKIKKAGNLNQKPANKEEVKKKLLNLHMVDDLNVENDEKNGGQERKVNSRNFNFYFFFRTN